ncbi:MAG: hypothetical protein H6R05_532 [Burkholderiaceae bacterium]|nr:hypothetical protein [Burkholderiaceae bacterium]
MKKKSILFSFDELIEIWSGLDAVVSNAHLMIKANVDKESYLHSLRVCYSASNKVQRAISKLRDEGAKSNENSTGEVSDSQSGFKIINN